MKAAAYSGKGTRRERGRWCRLFTSASTFIDIKQRIGGIEHVFNRRCAGVYLIGAAAVVIGASDIEHALGEL